MKQLMLLILGCTLFAACSKDDHKESECGAVITQTFRSDGGVQEKVSVVACGDAWRDIKGTNIQNALFFNKGENRSAVWYLVATKTDTIYIRYGGTVPTPAIDSFKNVGYTTRVATITGLEHINWP